MKQRVFSQTKHVRVGFCSRCHEERIQHELGHDHKHMPPCWLFLLLLLLPNDKKDVLLDRPKASSHIFRQKMSLHELGLFAFRLWSALCESWPMSNSLWLMENCGFGSYELPMMCQSTKSRGISSPTLFWASSLQAVFHSLAFGAKVFS